MRYLTCYVYDPDDCRVVREFDLTLATKAGYTKPTAGEMDELVVKLTGRLHKTERALRRLANSSPFTLAVTVEEWMTVSRDGIPADIRSQADQMDADSVRHIFAKEDK